MLERRDRRHLLPAECQRVEEPASRASATSRVERGPCRGRRGRRDGLLDAAGLVAVAEVLEQQRDREHRRRRVGDAGAGDVGRCRAPARTSTGWCRGVDVAAGREADAAGDRRTDVGEDVAEQVVGDDDVEALGLRDEEHRRGVDVLVVGRDVGNSAATSSKTRRQRPPACTSTFVLCTSVRCLRSRAAAGEGVADHPLDAVRGVEAGLGRDLVPAARAERPPLPT